MLSFCKKRRWADKGFSEHAVATVSIHAKCMHSVYVMRFSQVYRDIRALEGCEMDLASLASNHSEYNGVYNCESTNSN